MMDVAGSRRLFLFPCTCAIFHIRPSPYHPKSTQLILTKRNIFSPALMRACMVYLYLFADNAHSFAPLTFHIPFASFPLLTDRSCLSRLITLCHPIISSNYGLFLARALLCFPLVSNSQATTLLFFLFCFYHHHGCHRHRLVVADIKNKNTTPMCSVLQ
jgi:hypothetical protein